MDTVGKLKLTAPDRRPSSGMSSPGLSRRRLLRPCALWAALAAAATTLAAEDAPPTPAPGGDGAAAEVSPAPPLERAEPAIVPPPPHTTTRTVYFFPPLPPRLWAPLPGKSVSSGRFSAPDELREFVGEPFYAPLGTRLLQDSLPAGLLARLEAYHREREALCQEMLGLAGRLGEADLMTRQREWAALAVRQAARLEAHEREGDALRRDLIRTRDDWSGFREWRLGSAPFGTPAEAMAAQFQVFRAASYYQNGLSPAQRRLLREILLDMESMIELPIFEAELPSDLSPLLTFSPETARLRLPSQPTPEVAALVAEYEREKSALKQELRDVLYAEDDALFGFMRTARLEYLARAQEPRFAQVELLAERIRVALAASGYREPRITLPNVPPAVAERIDRYLKAQKEINDAVMQTVAHLQAVAKIERVAMTPTDSGRYEVKISLSNGPDQEAQMAYVRNRLTEFNARHAERQARLNEEREDLLKSVLWLEPGNADQQRAEHEARRQIESYLAAVEQIERLARYRSYQLAVLEPGLSPAQRRVLFAAALVDLELPLPSAALPPVARTFARRREPTPEPFPSAAERARESRRTVAPSN